MLSPLEREVVVLRAVRELIDSIVNFEVLLLSDADPSEVRFKTMTHAKFFNLVLVDLLSATDKKGLIEPKPYLVALKEIVATPHFDIGNSIALLRDVVHAFAVWLETPVKIDKVWLPTIDTEMDLTLTRYDLVKISGNICRHNVLRAVGIARDVQEVLANSGVSIPIERVLLVLADLHEWLHTNAFNYHSSTIAEFLNNIRWGIHEYLEPEYSQSVSWEGGDPPRYRFRYPIGMSSDFAKTFYWDLMNDIRSRPYMRRFQVTEWLKKRY